LQFGDRRGLAQQPDEAGSTGNAGVDDYQDDVPAMLAEAIR